MKKFLLVLLLMSSLYGVDRPGSLIVTSRLEKVVREGNGEAFHYRVHVENFGGLREMALRLERYNGAGVKLGEKRCRIDQDRRLVMSEGGVSKRLEDFELILRDCMDGEGLGYRFVNKAGEGLGSFFIVPRPIEAVSSDGARMSLLFKAGNTYQLMGSGFKGGEKMKLLSRSGKEVLRNTFVAKENGEIAGIIQPATKGQNECDATVTVIRADGSKMEMKYKWKAR